MRLSAYLSVCWLNTNIEKAVKQGAACIEYQQIQACEKIIPYQMPHIPWKMVSADIFKVIK